ncbi:class I SAM-dependent methyltransferase [Nonomuraea sp. NPDC050663]|uniref:class I SAM-dependent methyltransferase n=1 Tax=Nonomuraea sp. NPDC050663 TaxID=3364370 RepID=UPI0037BB9DED
MPSSTPFRANLARSVRLFRAFRKEQTDPDLFYGLLAQDTVAQLDSYTELKGSLVIDVGGGSGYFSDALRDAGARVVCVDCDAGEMSARDGRMPVDSILGSALDLPLATGSVGLCFSSNVLEHVPDPVRMADEMVRVTAPGGTVYLSYTNWLSPWGGHETSPWHYLGGHHAARRYARKQGKRPKNLFGESLYAVSAGSMIRWARARRDATVVDILPRYLPRWAKPVVRIPGLRELVTWNLVIVLRKH